MTVHNEKKRVGGSCDMDLLKTQFGNVTINSFCNRFERYRYSFSLIQKKERNVA